MAKPKKKLIQRYLALCLSKSIRGCDPNPTLIFSGCPEVAQLAALVLDRLGYTYHVVHGKALTRDREWVHHFWVDIPDLGLRIETNPSQILGQPTFAALVDIDAVDRFYEPAADYPELLERLTPEGAAFFSKLADEVAACVLSHERKSPKSAAKAEPHEQPQSPETPCSYCKEAIPEAHGIIEKKHQFCDEACRDLLRRELERSQNRSHITERWTHQKTDRRFHGEHGD